MKIEIVQEMKGEDLRFTLYVDGKENTVFWLGENSRFHRELACKFFGDAVYTILRDRGINPEKKTK